MPAQPGCRGEECPVRSLRDVRLVPLEDLKRLDPELVTFRGVNTPEELMEIEGVAD